MGGGLCAGRASARSSASVWTTRTPNPQVPSNGLTTSGPRSNRGVKRSGCETTYVTGIGAPAAASIRAAITLSRSATVTGYGFTMAALGVQGARHAHRDARDLLQHVEVVLDPDAREVDEASVAGDDVDHDSHVGERLHGLRKDAHMARAVGAPEQESDPQASHPARPCSAGRPAARPGRTRQPNRSSARVSSASYIRRFGRKASAQGRGK